MQVGPSLRVGFQRGSADDVLIEHRRQLRDGADHFALVVEQQAEMILEEGEARLRVLFVGEECVPHLDFNDAGGVAVAFDPRLEVGEGGVVAAGIQGMERMVVVVIFGAGNELFEGRRAILGEGEVFDVADVGGPRLRHRRRVAPRPRPGARARWTGKNRLRLDPCHGLALEG